MERAVRDKLVRAVYVPIDESEVSHQAVPLARTVARVTQATLHLVHTGDAPESPRSLRDRLQLKPEQVEDAVIEQWDGRPAESIPRHMADLPHSVVIMPTTAGERHLETGLGPVSEEVLRSGVCPVLFVPPGKSWADWKPSCLLLPQDSTVETAAAIQPVFELASLHQAKVVVLHVPRYSHAFGGAEPIFPFPRYMDQPQHEIPAWKQEFLDRVRELGHVPEQVDLRLVLGMGEPDHEILRWAERLDVDLIVMPWHCRFDYGHAGILKNVIRSSVKPVLILPMAHHHAKAA